VRDGAVVRQPSLVLEHGGHWCGVRDIANVVVKVNLVGPEPLDAFAVPGCAAMASSSAGGYRPATFSG
jgi:hypothetical protein